MDISYAQIFGSEFLGTFLLMLMGVGVCSTHLLPKSKGQGGGWLMINFGWGVAVFVGVYAAFLTGGHLNPAVTIALAVAGADLAPGVPATAETIAIYIIAQMLGAFVGACAGFLAYKKHYDEEAPAAFKLATFCTAPEIRNYALNVATEALATFVLIAYVLVSSHTQSGLGPFGVAFVIVGIGACLGGPTGYAINPARDLAPRIAHAILPIKGKGGSDWSYAWVPVVGPIVGAVVAALIVPLFYGAAW